MQVLPELLRVLNFEFLKTQVIIESKKKQNEPIGQDVVTCVQLGSDILRKWLEENQIQKDLDSH
jgi:hypothetical protein